MLQHESMTPVDLRVLKDGSKSKHTTPSQQENAMNSNGEKTVAEDRKNV